MFLRITFTIAVALFLFGYGLLPAEAADGKTDRSFNSGPLFPSDVFAIVVQPDGKILVGGDFAGPTRNGIARLHPNGSLDEGFGFAGSGANQVRAVALQPDGKILIGGYFTSVNGTMRSRIARLNADGTLDTSFNPGTGVGGFDIAMRSIVVQADGKIMIGGLFSTYNGMSRINIARLNPDGGLDESFNAGTVTGGATGGIVTAIVPQPDGKLLVGGYFTSIGGTTSQGIIRLGTTGTPDPTFASGTGTSHGVNSVELAPDGKVLIGGFFTSYNGVTRNYLARLNSNGSLDTSFNANITPDFVNVFATAVTLGGKVVLVGNFETVGGVTCNRICRVQPNGDIDLSFRSGTDSPIDYVYTLAMQPDNKPIVGGSFTSVRGVPRNRIARLINSRNADFDGEGKTDVAIFRPSGNEWWVRRSSDNTVFATQFGGNGDVAVPSDFTGDGKNDIAVFRPSDGSWYVLRSDDFSFYSFPFGIGADIPAPADFDGDGRADPTVYRQSNATWYIARSNGGTTISTFGNSTDQPVPADYDADGRADIAVWRANGASGGGEWWLQRSTAGTIAVAFGTATDKAVPGDWTGDGKSDIAFFRPSSGTWFVLRSEDSSYYSFPFGLADDMPSPGDYDGDGKLDAGIFRGAGQWIIGASGGGSIFLQFGVTGDKPVAGLFVR